MVRRSKQERVSQSESMTEDDRSSKSGGFFSNWFNAPSRTETRDDSEYSAPSGSTDSIDHDYPTTSRSDRVRSAFTESFATDSEYESDADDDSLFEFDRELRVRHGQACKYMRVSAKL